MFLPLFFAQSTTSATTALAVGKLSCSASVEHRITQYISVDEDGVEDTVYAVQRVFASIITGLTMA